MVEKQWVDFVSGGADHHRDPYLFTIVARAKSEDLVPKVKETIDRYVADLQQKPIDVQRLERIKSYLRYAFALGLDTPGAVARVAADAIAVAGDIHAYNKLYRQYPKVTAQDIQRVARDLFRPQNETLVTLSHKAPAGEKPAAGAAAGTGGAH